MARSGRPPGLWPSKTFLTRRACRGRRCPRSCTNSRRSWANSCARRATSQRTKLGRSIWSVTWPSGILSERYGAGSVADAVRLDKQSRARVLGEVAALGVDLLGPEEPAL